MARTMNRNFEQPEFLLCSLEQELRTALLRPEKTRKQPHLPQ